TLRCAMSEESTMKKWILSLVLASVAAVAWAVPTLQEVEAEVQAGRWAQAETMMREVIAAKPNSARAHYVHAELLAHQGKVAPGATYRAGVPGQPGPQGPQGPYGPGYQGAGYPPQRSSMLGTGLAAAGGVAAGMLASEMLHRHGSGNAVNDDSGAQPGFFDSPDAGRNALEDRPVDFGNGGDWDAGSSDAGGGFDGGSGGGWD